MFTQIGQYVLNDCVDAIWSLKGLEGPHLFILVFFFVKNLNHIAKVTSILHFKSYGSNRPSYLSTSTPSGHTSHHHGQLIASGLFLTWKNTNDLLQTIGFQHG
jgi:hypothetical protein